MKKTLLIIIVMSVTIVQNIYSQRYPSGSWVRRVTPQNMPKQPHYETYEEAKTRMGQCDPSEARLYEAYAEKYNNGDQHNIPDLERINYNLKYIGQVGQYITTFEYPLKNLPLRYKYAGKNNYGNSVFYMASRDLVYGNEFINKTAYLIVFTDGTVGIGGDNMGMKYYIASSEAKLQQRLNDRMNSGYSSSNNSGGSVNNGYYNNDSYDGGYSSGSSSSSSTTKSQSTTRSCTYCHGTGTCTRCHGTGWYQVSHTSNKQARCGCGNGKCRYCNGTGQR